MSLASKLRRSLDRRQRAKLRVVPEVPIKSCYGCRSSFTRAEWSKLELVEARIVEPGDKDEKLAPGRWEWRKCSCGDVLDLRLEGLDLLDLRLDPTDYAEAFPHSSRPNIARVAMAMIQLEERRQRRALFVWALVLAAFVLALASAMLAR